MTVRIHAGVVRKKGSVRDTVRGGEGEREQGQQETPRERGSTETKGVSEDCLYPRLNAVRSKRGKKGRRSKTQV